MQPDYQPRPIELEAQAYWEAHQSFRATEDPGREKFYCLSMFPYPSGKLHMGHVRNYTIGDVIARYQRMRGKNVLQPMGWDAFGLPAENAALKHGVPPARWTYANIEYMKEQLRRLGFGYDWARELATCRPDYYRWEQWLFTQLYRKGLVYRKSALVNWDPVDQTVLANEQVIDGRGWRSGALVERREIPQWFLKITAYAEELLIGLDQLVGWPEQVRTMQRNWIGRSEGVEMEFAIAGSDQMLNIYTTRPDTLMGVTFVAVAAEHPLTQRLAETRPDLQAFIEECRLGGTSEADLETLDKRGIPLGVDALHPVSGEPVPVYVANFVLMGYGTGAVMAVPGHDQRDWELAERYGIPKRQVIFPASGPNPGITCAAYVEKGVLRHSGPFDGLTSAQAFEAIAAYLKERGRGHKRVNYRLRDWGISRQRYWGAPIPIVHCGRCGVVPVPLAELPVLLPEAVVLDEHTHNPLIEDPDWARTRCPECGEEARRETDTFDTFMESSWYYARFACPDAGTMLDGRADYWLPVDHYIGGIEHAILHLLYARFYHKLLRDAGLVVSDEPFTRLLTQGMVVADTYFRENPEGQRSWFNPAEVDVQRDERGRPLRARLASDGKPVAIGALEKMSKSKNNGVDPQTLVDRYGADTVRLYILFTAPPEQSLEWSDEGVEGAHRFLKRLWSLARLRAEAVCSAQAVPEGLGHLARQVRREVHETLRKAHYDYERQQLNTLVSACMTLVNGLHRLGDTPEERAVLKEGMGILLRLLAPIAPHLSHYLWRTLGYGEDVLRSSWPEVDEQALLQDTLEYVVQVNGKVRGKIQVPAGMAPALVEAAAVANENVQRFLAGAQVRKVVLVPNKLVNIVAG